MQVVLGKVDVDIIAVALQHHFRFYLENDIRDQAFHR